MLIPLLVLAVLAGAFLYGRNQTDGQGTAANEAEGTASPSDGGSEQSTATGNPPQLLIDGQDALDQIGPSSLAQLIDKRVQGENMRVLEQVNSTTYWIGTDDDNKVLLSVARNSGQATPQDANSGENEGVDLNTLVEFDGTFRGLQATAEQFNLDDEADAKLLRTQGAYIYAETFNTDS